MLVVLIRTLIIYIFLLLTMRFMGKRQLGELEISELVTTLLLSEIAALPITNTEIPLLHALVPALTLISAEVLLSAGILRSPRIKSMLSVRPTFLIYNGEFRREAMRSVRMSNEELMSQLRQNSICDISEVEYAVLEPNGAISVFSRSELGTSDKMMHIIISDGNENPKNLALINKDRSWLEGILSREELKHKDILMMLADASENITVVTVKGKIKKLSGAKNEK